jgi:lysine 2,3-aminomutase
MFPQLTGGSLRVAMKQGLQLASRSNLYQASDRNIGRGDVRLYQSTSLLKGQVGLAQAPVMEDIVHGIIDASLNRPQASDRPQRVRAGLSQAQEKVTQLPDIEVSSSKHAVDSAQLAGETDFDVGTSPIPAYFRGTKFDRVPYWQKIGRWKDITEENFLSYRWSVSTLLFGIPK